MLTGHLPPLFNVGVRILSLCGVYGVLVLCADVSDCYILDSVLLSFLVLCRWGCLLVYIRRRWRSGRV